ncbi:MAG: cupin domain-containing protein [Bacteroidetes bacterium]|nr:cupin domain-containing protein [Bacteroidota bacterium]
MQNEHHFTSDESREFFLDEGCFILEVLNQKDKDLSISRARLEVGKTTEPHRLRDMQEWYYILSGEGNMHLGEKQFGVGVGDVVHIPANMPQWIENIGNGDLIFLCICLPGWAEEAYQSVD